MQFIIDKASLMVGLFSGSKWSILFKSNYNLSFLILLRNYFLSPYIWWFEFFKYSDRSWNSNYIVTTPKEKISAFSKSIFFYSISSLLILITSGAKNSVFYYAKWLYFIIYMNLTDS